MTNWQSKPHTRHGRGRNARRERRRGEPGGPVILYGWHTVLGALKNPARHIRKLLATENAVRRLSLIHI